MGIKVISSTLIIICLIFMLLPFTKIAHCVLMPYSQIINGLAWRFPADTDEAVCTTLNKKGAPV